MKNFTQIQEAANTLIENEEIKNVRYLVTIRENYYKNTGDANYLESEEFSNLEDAYNFYVKEIENISIFETRNESEYKEVELILASENNYFFETLENKLYNQTYSVEDYGKYILHYFPKNNGCKVAEIEIIDKKTKFYINDDDKFSLKSIILDTKEDVIEKIYNLSLYISKEEAEEIFELSIS